MRPSHKRLLVAAGVLIAGASPAFAHLDPAEHGSFMSGLSHPLFGLDHILAMVAVGLWAAMIGGRAIFAVPAAFVGAMLLGFMLAITGVALPVVEPVILASVIALGFLVAAAVRLPAGAGMAIVGAFALFHGFAHGGEIGAATELRYGLGFAIATAALHFAGVGIGLLAKSGKYIPVRAGNALARGLGGVTIVLGAGLAAGWV